MTNNRDRFLVKPGAKFRIGAIDPAYHGKRESQNEAQPELDRALKEIDDLQMQMYAEHRHSLLIVLQGMDASGKDGVIRHVFSGMNPLGCSAAAFKQPTPIELEHDFLWRVHPHTPARGQVAIFNRSHYEDVLVARVHRIVPKKIWQQRYKTINAFERLLARDNDTTVLKFFLHISADEQLARFEKRLDDQQRQWKISEADYAEREHWDEYMEAFEEAIRETSTVDAPWYVIPANHKWFGRLAISEIIVDAMEQMKISMPRPTVDVEEIRRKYHAAARQEKRAGRGH